MSTTEAQREASRNNGKKSRGPKTDEGKEVSKKNALKHGLSGEGVVVPPALQAEVDRRVEEWTRGMQPREGLEAWLVRRAATASVRIDAAVRCEFAQRDRRIQEETSPEAAREPFLHRAEELGRWIDAGKGDGGRRVRELRGSVEGCDWLIGRWSELLRRTRAHRTWEWKDFVSALQLLGKDHLKPDNDLKVALLNIDYWIVKPDGDRASHHDGPAQFGASWPASDLPMEPSNSPPTPEERRNALSRIETTISETLAELHTLRDRLHAEDLALEPHASDCLLVDTSPDGTLLRRYEVDLDRVLHNALRQFQKVRKEITTEDICNSPSASDPASSPPRNEPEAPVSRNEPEVPAGVAASRRPGPDPADPSHVATQAARLPEAGKRSETAATTPDRPASPRPRNEPGTRRKRVKAAAAHIGRTSFQRTKSTAPMPVRPAFPARARLE